MYYKFFSKYLIYSLLTVIVITLISSCKSKKYTSDQNQYFPAPPIENQWPIVDEKPDVDINNVEVIDFKIALILPFELQANLKTGSEEITDPQILKSSLPAMHFYEGALLAIDSCNTDHKKISVQAFDAPKDSLGLLRILNNSSFGNPGLIIATLPNGLIETAANIAKRRKLNIIFNNAAKSDFLKDNPNAAIAYTSTISQCKEMVDYMMNTNMNENVILIYRTINREDELANAFRDQIMFNNSAFLFKDFNASKNEIADILKYIRKDKKNLVFLVSSDEAFVSPVITLLNEQQEIDSNIVNIAGLPTWQQFESIDFMAYSNLNYYVFENNFIDYTDNFNKEYRKKFIDRYHSDPLPSAFNGFNLVYNIGKALKKNQPSMSDIIQESFQVDNKQYMFVRADSGGFENLSISILRIKDYSLTPANIKKVK